MTIEYHVIFTIWESCWPRRKRNIMRQLLTYCIVGRWICCDIYQFKVMLPLAWPWSILFSTGKYHLAFSGQLVNITVYWNVLALHVYITLQWLLLLHVLLKFQATNMVTLIRSINCLSLFNVMSRGVGRCIRSEWKFCFSLNLSHKLKIISTLWFTNILN